MNRGDTGPSSTASAARAFLFWLPALLLSWHPLSTTIAANVGWLPIPPSDIVRAAAAVVFAVTVPLAVLEWFDGGRGRVAIWLAATLLPFVAYGWLCDAFGLDKEDWRLAAVYTVGSLLLATLAVRPWQVRRRDPVPLLIVGLVMLIADVASLASTLPSSADRERWGHAVNTLTTPPAGAASGAAPSAASASAGVAPSRDIYYIILDGFGSPDVLREHYDLDLQPFVAFLRARGFYVAEKARSNYAQTYPSIASTLNLNYLDTITAAMGTTARDRHPLGRAIRTNALMSIAHDAGYDISAITSDYDATLAFDAADRCTCERFGLTEVEQAALSSTPLAALRLGRWTLDGHRRMVLDAFAALATAARDEGHRTFVFAHLVAPHPPFLFNADGSRRTTTRTLMGFRDGSHFPGSKAEYVSGYRAQTQFVVQQLTEVVTELLDRRGPPPAIVIHGDHGPGLGLDWEDANRSDLRERMGIFAAYHFPGEGRPLYPTITPVNGVRALATRYLGVTLPYLPDHSHFSTWMRPFDFATVPAN